MVIFTSVSSCLSLMERRTVNLEKKHLFTSIVSGMHPLYTLPKPPSPSMFSGLKESVASTSSRNVNTLLGMLWLPIRSISPAAALSL